MLSESYKKYFPLVAVRNLSKSCWWNKTVTYYFIWTLPNLPYYLHRRLHNLLEILLCMNTAEEVSVENTRHKKTQSAEELGTKKETN